MKSEDSSVFPVSILQTFVRMLRAVSPAAMVVAVSAAEAIRQTATQLLLSQSLFSSSSVSN
jgi:hypothetical protein